MLSGYIVPDVARRVIPRNSDDSKRGVLVGVHHLALERLDAPAHNVGLRQPQLGRELVEAAPLRRLQINLNRLAYPLPCFIMISSHDIMILYHDPAIKLLQSRSQTLDLM